MKGYFPPYVYSFPLTFEIFKNSFKKTELFCKLGVLYIGEQVFKEDAKK